MKEMMRNQDKVHVFFFFNIKEDLGRFDCVYVVTYEVYISCSLFPALFSCRWVSCLFSGSFLS